MKTKSPSIGSTTLKNAAEVREESCIKRDYYSRNPNNFSDGENGESIKIQERRTLGEATKSIRAILESSSKVAKASIPKEQEEREPHTCLFASKAYRR